MLEFAKESFCFNIMWLRYSAFFCLLDGWRSFRGIPGVGILPLWRSGLVYNLCVALKLEVSIP
jgi:hypothetical protein